VYKRSARTAMLIWLFIAPLVCYCASYVFSGMPDYVWHIETSLTRRLIQLAPVGWLLIALFLAQPKRIATIGNQTAGT
jgi:hypothetical protein